MLNPYKIEVKNGNNQFEKSKDQIRVFCFNLTNYSSIAQFLLCCTGIFNFYILYGFIQEIIFSVEGFKPYGWFLTLVQFAYYTFFSFFERLYEGNFKTRCIPIKTYFILAFLTLGTMGLSNYSLGYLNYPTQVIFKCCKIVPVLCGSILIQKKQHTFLEFLAAIFMCIGLTLFTLADSKISPKFNSYGVLMITLALVCDAAIGNVQEKAIKEHKAHNNEIVYYSYGLGFIYLFLVMTFTGNFWEGFNFCSQYPVETYGLAFLFSLSGYLGIQFVLTLVRICGSPIAATVTTARKAATISLSFIFFNKQFSLMYFWSGIIVVIGIYLNVLSKKKKITFKQFIINCKDMVSKTKTGGDSLFNV